jgi:hypothetical protein
MSNSNTEKSGLPADDQKRNLTLSRPDTDRSLPHIGIVGDTYTITVSGDDTNGRFCVIDMHVPPGGGHFLTVTTSKKPSSCWKARSKPLSGEKRTRSKKVRP